MLLDANGEITGAAFLVVVSRIDPRVDVGIGSGAILIVDCSMAESTSTDTGRLGTVPLSCGALASEARESRFARRLGLGVDD